MTTYLSSFIIDPVVRQVRRLSNSGFPAEDAQSPESGEQSHPPPTRIAPTSGAAAEHNVTVGSVVEEGGQDDGSAIETMDHQPPAASISGRPMVSSPAASPTRAEAVEPASASPHAQQHSPRRRADTGGRRGGAIQTSTSTTSSGRRRTRARTQPIIHPSRQTSLVDDETTNNPSVGNTDRFIPELMSSTPGSYSSQMRGVETATTMTEDDRPSRRSTANSTSQASGAGGGGRATHGRNGSLPADDGQSDLRRRIVEIQGNRDVSSEEKARLMHILMTEPYSHFHPSLKVTPMPQAHSPGSLHGQHGLDAANPTTAGGDSDRRSASPASVSSIAAELNFHLTTDDIAPTYYTKPVQPTPRHGSNVPATDVADIDGSGEEPEEPALGCEHYKRNVKLQCSSCSKWYTCRFCHDQTEDHALVRKETKNMLCMLCGYAQPAGELCTNCGEQAAYYYCDICKLWDDDNEKSIYHCNDCGICRVGRGLGKDFYHCKTCCVCMCISIADSHRCIERSTDCDCPICGEYMFTSPLVVVFMECGHSIHHKCYYDHMKSSYKCPICSRSIVNMEVQFRKLDRAIESQPMPPQFQDTKALVYCNDCCAKSSVKYHWLGLKCGVCDSYNTAQIQILTGDQPSSPPLPSDPTPPSSSSNNQLLEPPSNPQAVRPSTTTRHLRRPTSSSGHGRSSNVRFSPYAVPARTGRSVSPMPTPSGYLDSPETGAENEHSDVRMDSDEEEIDFWGGDGTSERRGSRAGPAADADDEPMDLSDGEDAEAEAEEDEGEDEDDGMQLFGHR